jgi:RNA polymerase sigma factor (sigma-70 family)
VSDTLIALEREIPRDDAVFFTRLYHTSRDDVYAFVAGMLRNRSAAEEATATTFERAYRHRKTYDPERGTPRAWLFTIAFKVVVEENRKRRRRQAAAAKAAVDPRILRPTDVEEDDEREPIVLSAVDRLCDRDRELIGLKFWAGLSNREIATVLGISESSVGTKLHRTLKRLKEMCNATV